VPMIIFPKDLPGTSKWSALILAASARTGVGKHRAHPAKNMVKAGLI